MKKIALSPWLALLTLSLVICLRVNDPSFVESVRLRFFDTLITAQPINAESSVEIVNIDDATIKEFGQFPFPRDKYKQIIEKLYEREAGLVVFNIFTPDADRFGKDSILQDYLNNVPVILPQTATNDDVDFGLGFNPGVAEIGESAKPWVAQYKKIHPNIFNSAGIGVVNTLPEIDGVVRRLPMLISANDILYPSIALETLRVAAGDPSFQVKTTESGIEAVRIPQYGKITTDEYGRIWVDWSHRPPTSSYTNLPESFNRKIVIVGVTGRGLSNPVASAVGEQYPHQLQGAILDTILSNSVISRPDWAIIAELGFTILLSIISILLVRWKYGFIPVLFAISSLYFICGYVFDTYKFLIDCTIPILGISLVYSHSFTVKFITELNAKLQIKKQFGTYLSPALVEKLQKNPELLRLGGERRQLSIMFTDVRGFTSISEHYGDNVEGLTSIMNRYMTAMTAAIIRNNGTLDKYIGDAQMAFWNAPLDEPDHAKLAVKTALEMLGSLDEFNKEIAVEGVPAFGMGLGINTADVVVGNMGSDQRFDYSCIGDGVNLASRLEGQSKPYGVGIILGPLTAQQVKDTYPVVELDCIAVKGKKEGVKIYTLADEPQNHAAFLDAYYEGDWFSARVIADELVNTSTPLQHYYENMLERINAGKPENWDGTFRATSK